MKTAVLLREKNGSSSPLHIDRWVARPTDAEEDLLVTCPPPVLDIGCGPGRHVHALASRGIAAMGIDIAPSAVELAREKGVAVLERCVFETVPGAGRWGTALLLDGNIGIGGDPLRLLRRVASLLRRDGRSLIELHPPGRGIRHLQARIEASDRASSWFPWAEVGAEAVEELASEAGFRSTRIVTLEDRWFAWCTC